MEYTIPETIGLIPTEAQSEYPETDTERRLAIDILDLWDVHVHAQNTVATTKEELKVIRQSLGERLHEMKQLLARPGRNGEWSPFLKEHKIPRTTADRLVAAHERSLAPETNCTNGAISEPTQHDIQEFFTSVWPKLAKTLTTPESVYKFVSCIITRTSIPHDCRDEGILMFRPTAVAQEEPQFVVSEHVPPAETADGNYGGVV